MTQPNQKTGPRIKPNNFDKLVVITSTMDVPENKKGDVRWLSRNLGVRNSEHPQFREAMSLVRQLMFAKD